MEEQRIQEQKMLSLTFHVDANDVFYALNQVDTVRGSARKQKAVFVLLLIVVALYLVAFFNTRNILSLLFAAVFSCLALFTKRRALANNYKLAKSFEEEAQQCVELTEEKAVFGERSTEYSQIQKVYDFDTSFTVCYMQNYFYVIPKRLLSEEQQIQLKEWLKNKIPDQYEEHHKGSK